MNIRAIFISFSFLFMLSSLGCSHQPKRLRTLKNDRTGFVIKTNNGECTVSSDKVDPLTGVRKTDLQKVQIFSFTHERLKNYFENEPFLTCKANLSIIDQKEYLLHLTFVLSASKIKSNYKGLSSDAMLRVELINGENLFLTNIIDDKGVLDEQKRRIFSAIYPLGSKDLKALRKFEISELGVIWDGGFETYGVHEIDFLIRQLTCADSI